jgi:hypothetical protein
MSLIDQIIGVESGGDPTARNRMNNSRTAFDYFVSQGLSPQQAAGIVGNLQGESGQAINPLAVNPGDGRDGSDSVGIAQWNGARAQALKEYAASQGKPWTDLNTQLGFLHSELKGPEAAAYQRLMAAKTPEEAGQAMLAFERPKDWNKPGAHPERGQYAASAYATYAGGQPQPAQGGPLSPFKGIPQSPLPIFSQAAPQGALQPSASSGPSIYSQMPAEQFGQPPPIFTPPRKPIDLSRLRAALQQARPYGGVSLRG